MSTTAAEPVAVPTATEVPIEQVTEGTNVRPLDDIDGLTLSVQTVGILVPLIVVELDGAEHGYEVVAGHRRLAAARQAGLTTIPVTVTTAEQAATDQAVENIARVQLTPAQEAKALRRMLDAGLSLDGARDSLGWSPQRAVARAKLLELPEYARDIFDGRARTSLIPWLGEINQHLGDRVLKHVVKALLDRDFRRDLERDTQWFFQSLNAEYRQRNPKAKIPALVFPLGDIKYDVVDKDAWIGLDEETRDHAAAMVTKQYGMEQPYRLQTFSQDLVDSARAAGVLFEVAAPDEDDRVLYACVSDVEWFKDAAARQVKADYETFEKTKAREQKRQKKNAAAVASGELPTDEPLEKTAQRLGAANDRAVKQLAPAANTDLYLSLRNTFDTVKTDDIDVARLFVGMALGRPYAGNNYSYGGGTAKSLAEAWRLVAPECRKETEGKGGKVKVDYVTVEDAEKLMWKYLDGAKTAGDLFGRAIVLLSARALCVTQAVPRAQRPGRYFESSRGDVAEKSLARIVKAAEADPATTRKARRKGDNFDRYKAAEKARQSTAAPAQADGGQEPQAA